MIQALRREDVTEPHPTLVPVKDIKQAYKKWREQTNTSPENIHLGHYHALLVDDGERYDHNNPDQAELIWHVIYIIINTSIRNGRGPPRYETVHQLMMEKYQATIN